MDKLFVRVDDFTKKSIIEYYEVLQQQVVIPQSIKELMNVFIKRDRNIILVSPNHWIRSFGQKIGIICKEYENVKIMACQFGALKDALLLLNRKNISCYFFSRVGMGTDFVYSDSAQKRMKDHLSFAKMYQDFEKYQEDFRELIGEGCDEEYIRKLSRIPQVVLKGSVYSHEDHKSELVNVIGGKRITVGQPEKSNRTIHIYGRCGVFGYAVEDEETVPSQLQKLLCQNGYGDIAVVNHGLWGGTDDCIDHNFLQDISEFREGDIILFYRMDYDKRVMQEFEACGMWYQDLTEEYHSYPEARWCFYDRPGHMNRDGYRIVASLIFKCLIDKNFAIKNVDKEFLYQNKAERLNAYLKEVVPNKNFQEELADYLRDLQNKFPLTSDIHKVGAIVMNCNPFTYGHRYLIEYASRQVDRLYVFVVEEDRSFFRFADRFEMVAAGTEDLNNVLVVPSGKFMISAMTFPEYFLKDYVREKGVDVSMDLEIFGKNIAPALGITIRFAGEEPLDAVTQSYNEYMRKLLPAYGVSFSEIPRLEIEGLGIVNATWVRKLLQEKKYAEIKRYVPESTYNILEQKYMEK